jgi:hypothetical protein
VAFSLAHNVKRLAERFGVERIGFLTLTFADHVTDNAEASRRWKSLRTGVLGKRYGGWVAVRERQKSGRLHFHCIVILEDDIRTGADFAAFELGDYRSAGQTLRQEWAFWRETAPKYGFGRTELLPVKSTAEGIGRYVGKYVSKNIERRIEEDKGARLVMYSKSLGEYLKPNDFAWNTKRAWLWRTKLARVASTCGFSEPADFRYYHGNRWAWSIAERVRLRSIALPDPDGTLVARYPTAGHALADGYVLPADADYSKPLTIEGGHSPVVLTLETWTEAFAAVLSAERLQRAQAFWVAQQSSEAYCSTDEGLPSPCASQEGDSSSVKASKGAHVSGEDRPGSQHRRAGSAPGRADQDFPCPVGPARPEG